MKTAGDTTLGDTEVGTELLGAPGDDPEVRSASDILIRASEILLTGGGVGSPTWRQVVADICGAPVTVLVQDEGASFGAALQALAMLEGSDVDLAALTSEHLVPDEARCREPRPSAVTFYNETYNEYQQAVEKVAALYS